MGPTADPNRTRSQLRPPLHRSKAHQAPARSPHPGNHRNPPCNSGSPRRCRKCRCRSCHTRRDIRLLDTCRDPPARSSNHRRTRPSRRTRPGSCTAFRIQSSSRRRSRRCPRSRSGKCRDLHRRYSSRPRNRPRSPRRKCRVPPNRSSTRRRRLGSNPTGTCNPFLSRSSSCRRSDPLADSGRFGLVGNRRLPSIPSRV